MTYEDLRVTIADGIAELTLDRPGERNAFSGAMAASLTRAYRECDGRDDVRAVNGHAVGIGLTLAMQCDIRLVASEAKLAFAHVRRGVLPDAHAHWTVPRAIGFARTAELFLTGRHITGEEAATIGLASRALPAAEVLGAARAIARDIAVHCAPLSVALSKRLLWESRAMTREEVGQRETDYHHLVMGRSDALEGVIAFLERRPARWMLAVPRDWPETT